MNDDFQNGVTLGEIARVVRRIESAMVELRSDLKDDYVTRTEFWPVKVLVYGFAGLVLVGVVGALIALVVK